jgi:hypothetical protein
MIETYKRTATFSSLKPFDYLAKDEHFMEVTEWCNGEGFDIHLSSHDEQFFQLTWGEFKALKKLVKELDNG